MDVQITPHVSFTTLLLHARTQVVNVVEYILRHSRCVRLLVNTMKECTIVGTVITKAVFTPTKKRARALHVVDGWVVFLYKKMACVANSPQKNANKCKRYPLVTHHVQAVIMHVLHLLAMRGRFLLYASYLAV